MTDAVAKRLGLWGSLYSHGLQGGRCHFPAKTYKQRICLKRGKALLECIYFFTYFRRTTYVCVLLLSLLGCSCIPFSALHCETPTDRIAELLRRLLRFSLPVYCSACTSGRRRWILKTRLQTVCLQRHQTGINLAKNLLNVLFNDAVDCYVYIRSVMDE